MYRKPDVCLRYGYQKIATSFDPKAETKFLFLQRIKRKSFIDKNRAYFYTFFDSFIHSMNNFDALHRAFFLDHFEGRIASGLKSILITDI